jgi:hypothetical protein
MFLDNFIQTVRLGLCIIRNKQTKSPSKTKGSKKIPCLVSVNHITSYTIVSVEEATLFTVVEFELYVDVYLSEEIEYL